MIDIINTRASLNDRIFIYYAGLSGKLYQKNMIPIFEKKLFEAKRDTEKYQLNQILARLGRQKSVLAIQDSLRKMNIEDRLWQENVFLYVRQKPVIDLLLKDLLSNERGTSYFEGWMEKPLEKICAYDALKLLSKIVKDFPVKGKENYSEFDLEIARSWIKKHKNDYIIGE
ncbi:MAG: hypothetical protein LBV46_01150 [Bacteroidales bacterium]|jgi:hypothetical protein|nr:hypothetical protein [Bacteroidales bacterium]